MRYALSSRQSKELLNKCDEIIVQSRDYLSLFDLVEEYPTKTFILRIDKENTINWELLPSYNKNKNLICCLENLKDFEKCMTLGLRFYYAYPINSFFELSALKNLGVSYVLLGSPLFFQMDKIKSFHIPIRAIPNIAYDAYIPRENGIYGQWIRPEDISVYEEYVSVCEFKDADLTKEGALYRIYAEEQKWPGDLNMLITNLNLECNNTVVYKDLGLKRLNCRQICQEGSSCRYCERALTFGDTVKEYKESKQ